MRETTALYSLDSLLWTRSAAAHARSTGIRMTSRILLLTTSPPNRSYYSIERCDLYNTYWGLGGLEGVGFGESGQNMSLWDKEMG